MISCARFHSEWKWPSFSTCVVARAQAGAARVSGLWQGQGHGASPASRSWPATGSGMPIWPHLTAQEAGALDHARSHRSTVPAQEAEGHGMQHIAHQLSWKCAKSNKSISQEPQLTYTNASTRSRDPFCKHLRRTRGYQRTFFKLSLIHNSEPTRQEASS